MPREETQLRRPTTRSRVSSQDPGVAQCERGTYSVGRGVAKVVVEAEGEGEGGGGAEEDGARDEEGPADVDGGALLVCADDDESLDEVLEVDDETLGLELLDDAGGLEVVEEDALEDDDDELWLTLRVLEADVDDTPVDDVEELDAELDKPEAAVELV